LKKIEVTVVTDESAKVEDALKQMDLLFSSLQIKVTDQECVAYSVLVPDQLSDKVVDEVSKKIDLRIKNNTISVYNLESALSTYVDRLKEKASKESPPPNPLERLVEVTEKYAHFNKDVLIMAILATLVALAGLFLDNVVIVIGAMLLSPLLGPINAFAVNASLGKVKKIVRIQFFILVLFASVIVISAIITFITSRFVTLPLTAQITSRDQATLIDVTIGLILGFAGGLALFAAIPEMLVGVAVAVALVPPATVTGIGLALMDIDLFVGALLLTIVYLLGLQLGSTIMLRVKGVSPRCYYQKAEANRRSAYSILILSLLMVILIWIVLTLHV
jgi:uncharacterized hydrophobic protein (TIGR00341 family)